MNEDWRQVIQTMVKWGKKYIHTMEFCYVKWSLGRVYDDLGNAYTRALKWKIESYRVVSIVWHYLYLNIKEWISTFEVLGTMV